MEENKVFLCIHVDIEKMDAAFAEVVRTREAFYNAVYKFQNAVSDDSLHFLVKGNPDLRQQDRTSDEG